LANISYELPKKVRISLKIYDGVGRLVKILISETHEPGYYTITWNGKNNLGKEVPNGIYFCRLEIGGGRTVEKLVFIK